MHDPSEFVHDPHEVEKVHALHNQALAIRSQTGRGNIYEGITFAQLYDHRAWEKLGFDSWKAYLAAPIVSGGLACTYWTVMRKKKVAEVYVIGLNIEAEKLVEPGYSKLHLVHSFATEATVEEVLSNARALSISALKDHYFGEEAPKEKKTCPQCGYEL